MGTGTIRKIDTAGRIVLPKSIRKTFDLKDDVDSVEIFVEGDSIILKKYTPTCMFCGGDEGLIQYMGHRICSNCAHALAQSSEDTREGHYARHS